MDIIRSVTRLGFIVTTIIALASSLSGADEQQDKTQLAQKYMSLRGNVVMFSFKQPTEQFADIKLVASSIAENFLQGLNCGPDWNEGNPEWKRLSGLIEKDIPNLVAELDTPYKQRSNGVIAKLFVKGLASDLTKAELDQLVGYYSNSWGQELIKAQEELDDALLSGQADFSKKLMEGKKIPLPDEQDKKELQEIMGLLDEYVLLMVAYLDTGEGKDRSGLQAIPMTIYSGVTSNPNYYTKIWKKIPVEDRASIILWRSSPLAKKEREILMKYAKDIRRIADPETLIVETSKIVEKYDSKWRALLTKNPTSER